MRRTASLVAASSLALVAAALVAAHASADDGPTLPARLAVEPGSTLHERIELTLSDSFRSPDHRLRSLDDRATLTASLDLTAGERHGALVPLDAKFRELAIDRRFHAKISGFFSDSDRDGHGATAWREGSPDVPPGFRALLAPSGFALVDASPVTSESARWVGEGWLDGRDHDSDEDAKIRRLARYTRLGTLLGAPPLPAPGERRYQATLPLDAGESGLTNSFVELEVTFDLSVEAGERGLVRVHGPLASVRLVRGRGSSDRRVDRWLDVAFERGGPESSGELDATFDPALGRFREVRSRVTLAHDGKFDGGRGRATFERRLVAREE